MHAVDLLSSLLPISALDHLRLRVEGRSRVSFTITDVLTMDNGNGLPIKKQEDGEGGDVKAKDTKPMVRTLNRVPRK